MKTKEQYNAQKLTPAADRQNRGVARHEKYSFTLIELLVVMVIISVLVTITFSIAKYAAWRAREAQSKVLKEKIRAALEAYKADYGEYPVTGSSRHYSADYNPNWFYTRGDTNIRDIMPWRSFNLVSNPVISFQNYGVGFTLDHNFSLTYPLMIGQLQKGRKPYIEFDLTAIMNLSYNMGDGLYDYIGYMRTPSGRVLPYLKTRPIIEPVAIDPLSGQYFQYRCTNGVSYTLTP